MMENQNIETAQEQEKTFTQEQVNAIVGRRLAEQKQQLENEFVKREQELNRREMSIRAKELLAEKGLPKDLATVLRYDDEESLIKAIDTIEHTRGFKNNNNNNSASIEQVEQSKQIVEHRLERPTDFGGGVSDPIADAFKKGQ